MTGGRITIDGVDIRQMSQKKLRHLVGYVPQKGVLFSGSIASNIQFAGNVSEKQMAEAAEIAQAKEFISEKEEGYQSQMRYGSAHLPPLADNGKTHLQKQLLRSNPLSYHPADVLDPKSFLMPESLLRPTESGFQGNSYRSFRDSGVFQGKI